MDLCPFEISIINSGVTFLIVSASIDDGACQYGGMRECISFIVLFIIVQR